MTKKLAKDEGYTLILESKSGVVYFSKPVEEITDKSHQARQRTQKGKKEIGMKTPAPGIPCRGDFGGTGPAGWGEVRGVCEEMLVGIAGIREARKGQITFLVDPKYGKDLETTQASAVIVGSQFPQTRPNLY